MDQTKSRRVMITGVGLVSPLGNSPDSLWEALRAGRSGIATLQRVPTSALPFQAGGEARDFTGQIEDFGELGPELKRGIRKNLKLMSREIAMGTAAAQRALHAARFQPGEREPERCGVVFGSDYIMTTPDEFQDGVRRCLDEYGRFSFDRWGEWGLPQVAPLWLLKYLPNMPASHIAILNDLRGPSNSITLRESSANAAIAESVHIIRRGAADLMVAGATGSRIHPLRTLHAALQEQVACQDNGELAAGLSRPFDLRRKGMVLGEGAGAVVLEAGECAERRGVTPLAEVVGWGSATAQQNNGVGRHEEAIYLAMRRCLEVAEVTPDDTDHLHAHGLGTLRGDRDEARAIHRLFAARRHPVAVVAAKSSFGNLGAGSGAVELIASLRACQEGVLFPTLNYEYPDPDCPVSVTVTTDKPAGKLALNVNYTPQGQATAIMIRAR